MIISIYFLALYNKLKALPFPAGRLATDELKLKLLAADLIRDAHTEKITVTGKSRRSMSFDTSYVNKHRWMFLGNDGVLCIYCKLFCTNLSRPRVAGGLTEKPWTNYSKKKALDEHGSPATCKYHGDAEVSAKAFLARATARQPDVRTQVAGELKQFKEVKQMVESVSLSIAVAAKQNIALRGHRNEQSLKENLSLTTMKNNDIIIKGDSNCGNLNALVKLCYTSGDRKLEHLKSKPSTFISPTNQNEILMAMASDVRSNVISLIGDGPFSIIADETTDVGTTEQLCIALRFVRYGDDSTPNIEERYLTFVPMKSVTGLSRIIKQSLF